MSITAIPILGRIHDGAGDHALPHRSSDDQRSSVDDALGWILLATVAAMVNRAKAVKGQSTGAIPPSCWSRP